MKLFCGPRLLVLSWSVGSEVGFCLVRKSPFSSWTRGASMTPDCAKGRHRSWSMLFRVLCRGPHADRDKMEGKADIVHSRCAGLDVHKETVVACVRLASGDKVSREARTFGTTTSGLRPKRNAGRPDPRDAHVRPPGLSGMVDGDVMYAGCAGSDRDLLEAAVE